ncbi:ATP phosphoribosyltransferase regulatory subunit [Lacticaseibacillus baoqingensis]|uniref:ATP phosphoribosyltransferase regulatory subunit n=1 Tax=Lacticaseibacillus baoqingensis TaxID=2486013 RepID=A0ABW4E741_9LACO|nr:ATP phosphoribosyltransferase regulatory subunit [Lacticaseibacillus baoqingensis]
MSKRNLPVGTRDEFGPETERKTQLTQLLQERFTQQGFHPIKTPVMEYRAVFDAMAPTPENAYQFLEETGETLVLRPDLTLPIARVMSTTGITPPTKWCYTGDVFRIKKRHSGGYNQITQSGVEIIGYQGLKAEWECLLLAAGICTELKLADVTIELSDASFVDTVLAQLPLANQDALKHALFNKDLTAYEQLLKHLPQSQLTAFLAAWPWLFGPADEVLAKLPDEPTIQASVADLRKTVAFLEANCPSLHLTIDLSSQSPQPYYTGLVFHGYRPDANDYLFSGGRYDRLLSSFQQTRQPAVGFSFDLDALAATLPQSPAVVPTLIYFTDTQWAQAQALAAKTPNASLCLTDSLAAAKRQAQGVGANLIDLSQEDAQ